MFIGNFRYSIDSKGRISIPAKLRKYVSSEANDSFVMTRSTTGQCIDLFPMDLWRKNIVERITNLNNFDMSQAQFARLYLHEASEDTLDSQFRLRIPKPLIEFAGIESDVLILGVMTKIEVWSPAIYDEYLKKFKDSFLDVAQEVMKNNQ